jgi:hypothetical protein
MGMHIGEITAGIMNRTRQHWSGQAQEQDSTVETLQAELAETQAKLAELEQVDPYELIQHPALSPDILKDRKLRMTNNIKRLNKLLGERGQTERKTASLMRKQERDALTFTKGEPTGPTGEVLTRMVQGMLLRNVETDPLAKAKAKVTRLTEEQTYG